MQRSDLDPGPIHNGPLKLPAQVPRQPSCSAGPAGTPDAEDDRIRPWGHSPHRHPHAQFVGAIMGRATITVHDREFEADPSWGVWIPPNVLHSARFHDRYVPLIRNGGPVHREQPTAVVVDPDLRHALLTAQHGPDPVGGSADTAMAQALLLAGTGLRLPCPDASGRLTLPIVEALKTDPADPLTLQDWALQLHVSSISIRRAFEAEIGMSFSDWRTRARVNAAIVLLDEGEPVSATARAVGMSHNGLIAAFRRLLGVTPTSLRGR